MDLDFNVLDLLLLLGLLFAAVRGFRRGALSQIAAFGGAVAGLVAGAVFAPRLAGALVDGPGPTLALATLGLLLAAVFIGQGIGLGIGTRLRAVVHGVGAGPADRIAGVAAGVAGILLTVWLVGAALAHGPSAAVAQQFRDSEIVAAVDGALPPAPDLFAQVGNYLDEQGFPQVFSHFGGTTTAPPVDPPSGDSVAAAQEAGAASTVQVQATGCGAVSSGSGFVPEPGFVVTNAHVIAGGDGLSVIDREGTQDAVAIHFDPELDLAVLAAPDVTADPIGWVDTPVERDTEGATLGYPGGQRQLAVKPARVRARGEAIGRDIYGRGNAPREVLTLSSEVRRGDSGGPFVTAGGLVGGVVFAAAPAEPETGYAITAERAAPDVADAIARDERVSTGECRF